MHIIHFTDLPQPLVHIFQAGAGEAVFNGLLSHAPPVNKQAAIVLVSSRHLVLTRVTVPSKNRQKIIQAVPFLLEDELIDSVDMLHFGLGQQQRDGSLAVAAIQHDLLTKLQQQISQLGYKIQHIYPDVLVLPRQQQQWSLFQLDDMVLVRTSQNQGFVSEIDNLNTLLQLHLQQTNSPPKSIQLLSIDFGGQLDLADDILVDRHSEQSASAVFQSGLKQSPDLDLTNHRLSHQQQWTGLRPHVKMTVFLILLLATVFLAQKIYRVQQLNQQQQKLQQKITAIFQKTFPDITRIVNPRVQMERQLASMQQQQPDVEGSLLWYFDKIQTTLIQTKRLQLKYLSYQNKSLEFHLLLPSLQTLEQLKQKIKATGLNITIQSANSEQQHVDVRLRISQ